LVKDYGVIVKISDNDELSTGFIINSQTISKKYKQGQKIKCRVLDIDPTKKMADLSEKLAEGKSGKKEPKVGDECKVVVELNKDSFVVVSLKQNRSKIGFCILQSFNRDDLDFKAPEIGDELDARVVGFREGVMEVVEARKEKDKKVTRRSIELNEGTKFVGVVKSIKN